MGSGDEAGVALRFGTAAIGGYRGSSVPGPLALTTEPNARRRPLVSIRTQWAAARQPR